MPAHNVRAELAASSGTGTSSSGSTYTQTYTTANRTVAAVTGVAVTDSSGGTDGGAIAAGVGISYLSFYINLATLTDADQITAFTPGFKFKILAMDFIVHVPVTTGSKASTLNLEIGTTNLTGGVVALTSANCTPRGAIVAGTAVTAANTGTSADTVSLEATSTTAFAEGTGWLMVKIQNMDTADAFAALAAEVTNLIADDLDNRQSITAIIDDLQTTQVVD